MAAVCTGLLVNKEEVRRELPSGGKYASVRPVTFLLKEGIIGFELFCFLNPSFLPSSSEPGFFFFFGPGINLRVNSVCAALLAC